MNQGTSKFYFLACLWLASITAFTLALTFYSCANFYAYLPTSDTWVHIDFLAQASRGHLDFFALFEKHNNAHLIALPKLAYFFDMWLTSGSGALVVCLSLAAQLAAAAIFIAVVCALDGLDKTEKILLSLLTVIFLLSACQVESLLNPANLQWSLLVFTGTLTAWFAWKFSQKPVLINGVGACAGFILTTLTSASALLMLIPMVMMLFVFRFGRAVVVKNGVAVSLILIVLFACAEIIRGLFFPGQMPFWFWGIEHLLDIKVSDADKTQLIALFSGNSLKMNALLLANWLKFNADYLAPPIERLHTTGLSFLGGLAVLYGLVALVRTPEKAANHVGVFFGLILSFVVLTGVATGIVRSYSPTAFTFRFVNMGLLFAAALLPLMYLQLNEKRVFIVSAALIYVCLLSYINITETSAFSYGRNHIRLNQVAYSLDIQDSFVVSALPGTAWEKIDYDYVQANKHKLQQNRAGIYSSAAYQNVGKPITSLASLTPVSCKTTIIKMRRLLPEQPAYRLLGQSYVAEGEETGKTLAQVYFTDMAGIIRGYAISVVPSRKIWENLSREKQWAGFVNLESSGPEEQNLLMYPYSDQVICRAEAVELPAYVTPKKREQP